MRYEAQTQVYLHKKNVNLHIALMHKLLLAGSFSLSVSVANQTGQRLSFFTLQGKAYKPNKNTSQQLNQAE